MLFAVVSVSIETILGIIVALMLNAHIPAGDRAGRHADPLGDPDRRLRPDVAVDVHDLTA